MPDDPNNFGPQPSWQCAATAVLRWRGDGQVTLGNTILKDEATKVRRICRRQGAGGFAGAAADGFALLERFEAKLKEYRGTCPRGRRAGEGLAHGPGPAPARGAC